ncbi:MAG: TRAP transporter small permease subunit [Alphaproteobacteria bacterium]
MQLLLRVSRWIDALAAAVGQVASWLVLLAVLVSAGNAASRYSFSISSNAWLEIQWYMFAGVVLLGAAITLRLNEHVRVDLVYASVSDRARQWIDIFGIVLFLLPATAILTWMTWPYFLDAWTRNEMSSNAGGLVRWPVKVLLPAGFALLTLQGLSELIKRIAVLRGDLAADARYHRPLQ